ncbi:hypothetical protein [Intestinibacter sp.]|uniref:hypothetical protein n=1 Tax=Intestinibacter sp. TaxID=1965304 RepID=UPI002A75BF92|nr:hypothetical protein [Intestinibacter sp.]MDY2736759.1 hypothetical protein [Intestinibacter sp.]
MINNRQVNLWRGNQEPPTIYHIWIKDNNKLLLYDGNNWKTFYNESAVAAIQEALKKKANLVNGKVSANELPIATSLGNPNNDTIPSTFAVNEAINNKIVGLLNWRGVKDTTDEIKAIAPAKKGDVWHSNGDGSEWVCTQDITAANADAWTELGTPIDLSGYYTKTEVDNKVKPLADSIGTDSDAASANGSLYARIKKNAADIATKANQSDIPTAVQLVVKTI